MPGRITRILLVEDNDGDARLIRELLREAASFPHELIHVDRLAEARSRHAAAAADVILLDLSLPDAHGLETVERMLEAAPGVPMIVLTGLDDDVTALRAVHVGAQDYLVKGSVNSSLLIRSIRYARERKRLELERNTLLVQERAARAAAEAAVRARDEVLRVVSHDLGNALTAVVVNAEVLLRTQLSAPEELTRQRLRSICTTAEQMQRLRQDLLDFAMIEAGRLSMERRRVSPRKVLEEAFERHNALAAAKSISFVCSPDEGARAIRADEARLDQVLSNLLNNALKFTPVGGDIVLGARSEDDYVRFYVADTGPGIPEGEQAHLFERFWTTKAGNPHGAGLGLAIVKGIVDAHDGRIEVESRPGQGTTFSFTIPFA